MLAVAVGFGTCFATFVPFASLTFGCQLLVCHQSPHNTEEKTRTLLTGRRVIELGAGCGLPGLVAAAYCGPSAVVLTDYYPATMANLEHNVKLNLASGGALTNTNAAATTTTVAADWADTTAWSKREDTAKAFDVVIGADLVYHNEVIGIFVNTLQHLLRNGGRFLYVAYSSIGVSNWWHTC